jgi:hypothetical protein
MMQPIRDALAPLTDWIPPEVRDYLPPEGWWLVMLVLALTGLLFLAHALRRLRRSLQRPRRNVDWDQPLREVLADYPPPARPPASGALLIYHVPVRLRLVVLAPGGQDFDIEPDQVESLLDRLVPGLTAVAEHDEPEVRVWPGQLSPQGFINLFHRCTITGAGEGEPSNWVLVAGRIVIARRPLLFGLALWAEEPNVFGRINLEPPQWREILRLRSEK